MNDASSNRLLYQAHGWIVTLEDEAIRAKRHEAWWDEHVVRPHLLAVEAVLIFAWCVDHSEKPPRWCIRCPQCRQEFIADSCVVTRCPNCIPWKEARVEDIDLGPRVRQLAELSRLRRSSPSSRQRRKEIETARRLEDASIREGGMSFGDISAVIGISPERVRQIEEKALRQLRHYTRSRCLSAFVESPPALLDVTTSLPSEIAPTEDPPSTWATMVTGIGWAPAAAARWHRFIERVNASRDVQARVDRLVAERERRWEEE
jgi:hypothetical protein